jgi:hypothetical protein
MRWNSQSIHLKKEILDYLECMFGVDTFDKSEVSKAMGLYLKYIHDMYRVNLQKIPRYEHPPMLFLRGNGRHSLRTQRRRD